MKTENLTKFVLFLGNQPAGANPSKLMYMVSDLKLLSKYFGVPMFQPSSLSEKGIEACFSVTVLMTRLKFL